MATYYVDTSGSDSNSGLTTLLPWATMDKVNAFAFAAGDTILFKRGQTFAHQITCTRSGSAGAWSSWIAYGAYGSGPRPIIDGSANHIGACLINAPYCYLRFFSLDFTGSTAANYSPVMALSHDLDFYDCNFRDSLYFGYQGWSTTGAEIYNQSVRYCTATNNHNSGICISSNTGAAGPHDCLIEYCTAYANGSDLYADHGIYAKFGVTVRYNECYGNLFGAGIKINCETITTSPYDPIVYGNKCYGNFMGIYCAAVRARVFNNLLYGNEHNLDLDGDSDGIEIVFNTILNAAAVITGVNGIAAIGVSQNFTGTTIRNNLIIQDRAAVSPANIWRAVGTARLATIVQNNTIGYNVIYTDATVGTDIFTDPTLGAFNWTEWLALTGSPDATSTFLLALPGVIARYTNVGLVEGSNIYGKGIAVTGITTDKAGVLRPNPPSPGWSDLATYIPSSGTIANLGRMIGMSGAQADIDTGAAGMAELKFAYATDTAKIGAYAAGAWRWVRQWYYLQAPLTSTAWDGDPRSTTAKTMLDLSAVFGVPAGVSAVLVQVALRDSGSAANDCYFILAPASDAWGPGVRCSGLANDSYTNQTFVVPCDSNGDIYFQVAASGVASMDIFLQIWGWMI